MYEGFYHVIVLSTISEAWIWWFTLISDIRESKIMNTQAERSVFFSFHFLFLQRHLVWDSKDICGNKCSVWRESTLIILLINDNYSNKTVCIGIVRNRQRTTVQRKEAPVSPVQLLTSPLNKPSTTKQAERSLLWRFFVRSDERFKWPFEFIIKQNVVLGETNHC